MKHFVNLNIVLFLDPTLTLGVLVTIEIWFIKRYPNGTRYIIYMVGPNHYIYVPFYPLKMKHFVN